MNSDRMKSFLDYYSEVDSPVDASRCFFSRRWQNLTYRRGAGDLIRIVTVVAVARDFDRSSSGGR